MLLHLQPSMESGFNKNKIINDPVYGFITIPSPLVFDIIQHPWFQRLRRIRQLGLTELVYPGATHTRFHHALGALGLMIRAIDVLRQKGVEISNTEAEGAYLAILLHDIGHGPFSHTLEHTIVNGVHHEIISDLMMEHLNVEMDGALDLAIKIFRGKYPQKPFLTQLISGELDMDRLDYLQRDSFYTGVSEGIVGADRIIHMLHVKNGNLVVEEKGIYSVEKFLVARRLMYWQVYLHKTAVAADELLLAILQRARKLATAGIALGGYHPLVHFLGRDINKDSLDRESLEVYAMLDDNDIYNALKEWQMHEDNVLAVLSANMLNRKLPKVTVSAIPFTSVNMEPYKEAAIRKFNLTEVADVSYFVRSGELINHAYKTTGGGITILGKDGKLSDVAEASDNYNLSALKDIVTKYFMTWWK